MLSILSSGAERSESMKISELSQRAGVPIPSIKFYIREGLLQAGRVTAKNQASYAEDHVQRLELIRLLRDTLGMPVASLARVFKGVGSGEEFVLGGLDAVSSRGRKPASTRLSAAQQKAWQRLAPALQQVDFHAGPELLATRDALDAMLVIEQAMHEQFDAPYLLPYLTLVKQLATYEIPDDWDPEASPEAALRYALLGTFLFEPLILALRRLAHIERSRALLAAKARAEAQPPSNPQQPALTRATRGKAKRH
jgi:DNA-binding transcriptional MerR regulator